MCPILHENVCIDLKWNGYVLVLIEVELIHFVCSKCISSIWTKTNTNIITTWKKRTVVWPSVGMIITSNGRSQQTPSAKGGKGKIQWLDQVSCPDTEIQVFLIWELPWTGFHVLTRILEFWLPGSHERLALRKPIILFQKHGGACTMNLR